MFDASQYEFFGQHAGNGVELGGLEEDENPVFGSVGDEYRLFDRDEVRCYLLTVADLCRCSSCICERPSSDTLL
ncbi:unnamed protein product [Linum trigynum]|uniref:Uncharacterized protein n=1 Tax=Linum trigynum TaxID=586398 RepID=A0AAV2C7T8_9ROSI